MLQRLSLPWHDPAGLRLRLQYKYWMRFGTTCGTVHKRATHGLPPSPPTHSPSQAASPAPGPCSTAQARLLAQPPGPCSTAAAGAVDVIRTLSVAINLMAMLFKCQTNCKCQTSTGGSVAAGAASAMEPLLARMDAMKDLLTSSAWEDSRGRACTPPTPPSDAKRRLPPGPESVSSSREHEEMQPG